MDKIGLVGVGAMGSILLEHLRGAGLAVSAYDCAPAALARAAELGAETTTSSRTLAAATTIIDVVVRTDAEVLDCVTGKDGLLEGARSGTLILLHSTIHPRTTKTVAAAALAKGVDVLDACMLGSPRIARTGNITFLVGGPADLVERAKPHLLRMGKDVVHTGPLTTGNVAKIVKNLVTGAETLVLYEAARLAQAGGVDYRDALEILHRTYTGTVLDRWRDVFNPAKDDPMPPAGQNVFQKDIPLAATLAREYGLGLGITEQLAATALRIVEAQARK